MKSIESYVDQVIHGDCLTIMQSMPNESVDLIITDPPYLVNYKPRDGRRCANDDNAYWLMPAFQELFRVLKPDRLCISFYGWPWIDRFMNAWKEVGFRPVSHLVWVKRHCSREGYTRSHHEVGFLLAKGRPSRPSNPISDVLPWEYTGNRLHPNQKPMVGIAPLVQSYSHPGDIVLDPFAGSGSTGRAARDCGRRYILIEKDWSQFLLARKNLENA
jgi:DNA modification methylase